MRVLGHKSVDWKGCSVNGANDDHVKVFWPGRLQRSEEAKVVHKYFCVMTVCEGFPVRNVWVPLQKISNTDPANADYLFQSD